MKKALFEQLGGTYTCQGDYFLPDLILPQQETRNIGVWGKRRRKYLREHRNPIYTALLLGGKLDTHLIEIDQQAEEMFSQLVKLMAEQEGITEQLKAENQMEWVGLMNNARKRAEDIIYNKLIYT